MIVHATSFSFISFRMIEACDLHQTSAYNEFRMKQSTNAMSVRADYRLLNTSLCPVSLICSYNKFLTECLDLYVIVYLNKDHTLLELSFKLVFSQNVQTQKQNKLFRLFDGCADTANGSQYESSNIKGCARNLQSCTSYKHKKFQ